VNGRLVLMRLRDGCFLQVMRLAGKLRKRISAKAAWVLNPAMQACEKD